MAKSLTRGHKALSFIPQTVLSIYPGSDVLRPSNKLSLRPSDKMCHTDLQIHMNICAICHSSICHSNWGIYDIATSVHSREYFHELNELRILALGILYNIIQEWWNHCTITVNSFGLLLKACDYWSQEVEGFRLRNAKLLTFLWDNLGNLEVHMKQDVTM